MNEDSILTAAKAEIARARENGAELRLRDVAAKLGISISALYAVISACPDVHADYLAAKRNAKLVLARRIADAFLALAKEADAKGKTRRGSLFALEKEFDMTRENMRLLLRENLPEFYETHVRKNRSKSPKPPRAPFVPKYEALGPQIYKWRKNAEKPTKWRDIAEKLGISIQSAMQMGRTYALAKGQSIARRARGTARSANAVQGGSHGGSAESKGRGGKSRRRAA